jgi:hypothetical protein
MQKRCFNIVSDYQKKKKVHESNHHAELVIVFIEVLRKTRNKYLIPLIYYFWLLLNWFLYWTHIIFNLIKEFVVYFTKKENGIIKIVGPNIETELIILEKPLREILIHVR